MGREPLGLRGPFEARTGPRLSPVYEVFFLLLSLLSIFNSVLVALAEITGRTEGPLIAVLVLVEASLTPFFFVDFLVRLRRSPSRAGYFFRQRGWADLLATVPLLRIFRLFRVTAVVRDLQAHGPGRVAAELNASRALATFLMTIFLVVVVVEFASTTIYYAERGAPGANIKSAGDAVWWSLVTITTVGYGDEYPVTPEGRIIGVFLLFAGVGLFSVLTGFLANVFLAPRRRPRVALRPDDPRVAIFAVRGLLEEQQERTDAIRRQLDELERVVALSGAEDRPPPGSGMSGDPAASGGRGR